MSLIVSSSSLAVTLPDPTVELQAALTNFERVLSVEQSQQFHTQVQQFNQQRPDASSVIQFVAQIDAINHAKTRTSVSGRLCTFLDSARQFTDVVNTFVSSNPVIAALVWGGIKTTVLVASNIAFYFDKVASMIMDIGQICPVFREFSHLYSDSTALQQALCDYYAIVIRLLARVVQVSQRTVVDSIILSVVSPFESEFKPFQDELAVASRLVKSQISLAAKRAAQASARLLELESKENKRYRRFARKLASEIRAENEAAQQIRIQEAARKAAKMRVYIKDQLSTVNHQTPWKQALKQRLTDTAEWFRTQQDFQAWEADTNTATLWCSGRMGSGKTVLMSNIIAYLHASRRVGDTIAFHFCRSDDTASLSARTILGTLASQILDEYISNAHDGQLQSLHGTCRELSTEDIVSLLLTHFSSPKRYFIIIDGLDECPQDQIMKLATSIFKLCEPRDIDIKILCSGRPELEHQLFQPTKPKYRLHLSRKVVNVDIERYIDTELDECLKNRRIKLVNPETIWRIKDTLLAEHDGLLLFVRLFIEEICMLGSEGAILKALDNPPKKINDLLATRVRRVQEHDLAEDAMKLLQYCGCTKRPLTVNEFSELLSITISQTSLDRTSIPQNMDQIIAACCGLIYVEEEEATIHYLHHSVKNYLFRSSDTRPEAFIESETDIHLGCLCLTYLNFNDFKLQLKKVNAISNTPMAPIDIGLTAVREHSTIINGIARKLLKARSPPQKLSASELARKTEDILGEAESSRLRAELQLRPYYLLDYVQNYWIWHSSRFEENCRMWYRFSAYARGEHDLAKRPWAQDSDLEQRGQGDPSSATTWALVHDHAALLLYEVLRDPCMLSTNEKRDILKCGITLENHHLILALMDDRHRTTHLVNNGLYLAAFYGHETTLEFFVDTEVDINAKSCGRIALEAAAAGGHLQVVERLLTAKANVNACSRNGRTALHAAAEGGHLQVVERLLAAKANVDATDHMGQTALHAAAKGGHLQVIERLLAAKANVDVTHHIRQTALHAAAEGGHLQVVERLLAAKANVDATDHIRQTALHAAAEGGHLQVVERLKLAGARE